MDDKQAWKGLAYPASFENVPCALFSSTGNIVYAEDKSIRVRDGTLRTIKTREHDRFRSLSSHPKIKLFAAGHDSCFDVFKLERWRLPYSVLDGDMLYVRNGFLRGFRFSNKIDGEFIPIGKPGFKRPHTLSCSPLGNAFLVCSDMDGGSYELYANGAEIPYDATTGSGGSAVFVSPVDIAVLEESTNRVLLKNLKNETFNVIGLPIPNVRKIFSVGYGCLLCTAEDRVVLFDFNKVLGELVTSSTRYVVWSPVLKRIALLGKHSIIIADEKLVPRCTVREADRVKSGA